ncbi:nuclear transport factor 2 family protein [Woodsholea maritima]|uniref:nuclear transport factor 2 family protein n=1 Tax=Woodsholea maritima TaxID=240237 RepID=UPI000380C8C6|nr:nuclear transport factor 2 family protein [Woodsholea maritima]
MAGVERDMTALMGVMAQYFEGLYQADIDVLGPVFHRDARYVNASAGHYVALSLPDYLARVKARTPPAHTGDARKDQVISVRCEGDMAFITARMEMVGLAYLDYLTFIRTDETWQIIAKIFTHQPLEA